MKEAKNKKMPIAIIAPIVALVLVCAIALPVIFFGVLNNNSASEGIFSVPESTLPTEEKFALTKYDYADLAGTQTTVRADTSNILERGVERTIPEVLTDEYALVLDKTSNVLTPQYGFSTGKFNKYNLTSGNYRISNNQIEAAKISFKKYPRSMTIGDVPAYSIGGGDVGYDSAAMAGSGLDAAAYLHFYKYMLFSQCYNLTTEAATRSNATRDDTAKQEEFKQWLKKHPAADAIYGRVLGSDGKTLNETNNKNAVVKKITVDPLYRSLHASGLYLPAGEPITVKIEGLKPGEQIGLKMNEQDSCAWVSSNGGASLNGITFASGNNDGYFRSADVSTARGNVGAVGIHNHWSKAYGRLPWIRSIVNYSANGTYIYGSPLGGGIEIDMKNCYSQVTITISGAVETPHYILGTTTPEYFDTYLRQAPGVVAILDTENGQLIGPTMEMGTNRYMRQVKTDEIDKLAMLWHSFLSVNESFTGGTYNRFNKVMFDWLVPAGAAVSMGNYSFAQPTGWFDGCMNYRGLLAYGNWGTLHEIGHNHANSYGVFWGFGDGREGEVHNNALTLLAYIMFCDIGTTIRSGRGAEHGAYANPYATLTETLSHPANAEKLGVTDYGDGKYYHYFQMLGMYANIMHSFGAERFYELMYSYKANPAYNTIEITDPTTNVKTEKTIGNKRSDFAYRCAVTYGMNFIDYFNKFYKAGITDDLFPEEQLAYMKTLPNYVPVSCYYAGTIDGVKTAGDYEVTFGGDIVFDLFGKTVSTLDTAEGKGFEILSVAQPTHGKIAETTDESGKKTYTYSFNKEYGGSTDEFSFVVKLKDGIKHKFTVTLRITYNGMRISQFNDVKTKSLKDAIENIYGRNADNVSNVASAAIAKYSTPSGQQEVKVGEFYWRAPKSGTVNFAVKGDDVVRVYVKESFEEIEKQVALEREQKVEAPDGQLGSNSSAFKDAKITLPVVEKKYYAVKIINLNTGGTGNAAMGYKYEGEENYVDFSSDDVIHPDFPQGQTATKFIHEPKFLVSKKDNVKLSVTGTDKRDWKILAAPEKLAGPRFVEQQQYGTDPNDPETFNKPIGDPIKIDTWTYLIDGQAGTNLHTAYQGNVSEITESNPHVFVLDTGKEQDFNYFNITTRNNVNSFINKCALSISVDNLVWTQIATGTRADYSNNVMKLKFDTQKGRYFKIEVQETSSKKFSVLAELDTGIFSVTQKVLPITSDKVFATKGWVNSASDAALPSGLYVAEKAGEKIVIKFQGESASIYSAVKEGYGTVKIRVDGVDKGEYDLSKPEDMRYLAYFIDKLENKEHTMEIVTTSSKKVVLNMIGLPYSSNLLNAPNVDFERGLITALCVFIGLFVLVMAFVVCLVLLPKFRKAVFENGVMQAIDNRKESRTQRIERLTKRQKEKEAKSAERVEKSNKGRVSDLWDKNGDDEKPQKRIESNKREEAASVKESAKASPARPAPAHTPLAHNPPPARPAPARPAPTRTPSANSTPPARSAAPVRPAAPAARPPKGNPPPKK